MSNIRFMGPLMVPNDEPKSVNIDKISTALHVYYLNLIVNYLNTVQIAQIQAYNFECTPCSDAVSGPMNRLFDIKSGHDFCRYRNSIQVIYSDQWADRPWSLGLVVVFKIISTFISRNPKFFFMHVLAKVVKCS